VPTLRFSARLLALAAGSPRSPRCAASEGGTGARRLEHRSFAADRGSTATSRSAYSVVQREYLCRRRWPARPLERPPNRRVRPDTGRAQEHDVVDPGAAVLDDERRKRLRLRRGAPRADVADVVGGHQGDLGHSPSGCVPPPHEGQLRTVTGAALADCLARCIALPRRFRRAVAALLRIGSLPDVDCGELLADRLDEPPATQVVPPLAHGAILRRRCADARHGAVAR
jgi:hypothetical protein